MGIMKPLAQEGRIIWLAPLIDWSGNDILDYLQGVGLPINPVEPKLHRSGDCNCGSFGDRDEYEELRFWYPDFARRIDALEVCARAAGYTWGWGERPTNEYMRHKKGQQYLPGLEPGKAYMCSGCEIRQQILQGQREASG
jgi:3'-phosphoadenosine 5'-phosphosulfate sulfotransferase (PAPS reductase)/FAD synthetase